ncbi:hypothetical protein MHB77_30210 [Paenibacillus sp. FSL K6-3166]|uniref:hypothetical protein n=1 Tax=Paenibacillus sp. FSL K6-3166 TaxID=2921492 RepID=UPI0030F6E285
MSDHEWQHIHIPEHYEFVAHGGHVDLGEHEQAHIGFIKAGEGEVYPPGFPPTLEVPHGLHWVGIPGHYDKHEDHGHFQAPHWGLHGKH